jgi:hypothetical protein
MCLHYMHYNFCRIHKTLCITPEMIAGVNGSRMEHCRNSRNGASGRTGPMAKCGRIKNEAEPNDVAATRYMVHAGHSK